MFARRRVVWLAVLVVLVALVTGLVAALPEIVRRVAVDQLTRVTGRAVTLRRVELHLFRGRVALDHFALADRASSDAALAFDRLDVTVAMPALLSHRVRVIDATLTAPRIRATRTGPSTFDFSDLLALIPPTDPHAKPSAWTVTVERLAVRDGAILARDLAVTPAAEWRLDGLTIDGARLTTTEGASPGRLSVKARLNGAPLALDANRVGIHAGAVSATAKVDRVALAWMTPYLPPRVLALPRAGTIGADVSVTVDRASDGTPRGSIAGRVRVDGVELARRDASDAFLTLARADVTVKRADLALHAVTVSDVAIDGLAARATRNADGTIDLLPLVAPEPSTTAATEPQPVSPSTGPTPGAAPTPAAAPASTIVVDKVAISRSAIVVRDLTVTPAVEWTLDELAGTVDGISTAQAAPPARVAAAGRLNGAKLSLADGLLALQPVGFGGRIGLDDFDAMLARPYLPADLAIAPTAGRVTVDLTVAVQPGSPLRGSVLGSVNVAGVKLVGRRETTPLATLGRVRVGIKRADLATRAVALDSLQVEGLDLAAKRDAAGTIDVLELVNALAAPRGGAPAGATPAAAPAATPSAAAAPASAPAPTLTVDAFSLKNAKVTFTDEAAFPVTVLALTDLQAMVRDVSWPVAGPSTLDLSVTLPFGGHLTMKGKATPQPLDADLAISMRGAPIDPYAAYFPFRAKFAGTFNGDSHWELKLVGGSITAKSQGDSWADNVRVWDPSQPSRPPILTAQRMALNGIDFTWPTAARVARVTITRPDARIERERDGSMHARMLFEPRDRPAPPTPPSPPATPDAKRTAAPTAALPPQAIALDVGALVIEDGFARFLDRTTDPPFSETISKLSVSLEGVSSTPGRRAKLALSGTLGGDSTIEAHGDVAPFGDLYADLSADLRQFAVATGDPYMTGIVSWCVARCTLDAKVGRGCRGGRLTSKTHATIAGLDVKRVPAGDDQAQKKLGLPLGMIVGLVKDSHGRIVLDVPISGTLADPKFDWSDTIWAAVKNVVVNVAAAPFRAIGRLFTHEDKRIEALRVDPVTFTPGSAEISPAMERHVIQVADFLRRVPVVKLALVPAPTRADHDRLRAEALTTRLETIQKERHVEYPAAVAAAFAQRFPDTPPPPSIEDQVERLRAAEPVPEARIAELQAQRLEAVRRLLLEGEGIAPARLVSRAAGSTAEPAGDARVDFEIVPQ